MSYAQPNYPEMYRSHPVYSAMELASRRAGTLPLDVMRVTQSDFDAIDPATKSLSVAFITGGNAKSFSVDFGEGRKDIAIPKDHSGVYLNPTWEDTRFQQDGSLSPQFAAVSFEAIAPHFELEPGEIAHALSPYYDKLIHDRRLRKRLMSVWELTAFDCPASQLAVDHAALSIAAHLLDRLDHVALSGSSERLMTAQELSRVTDLIEDRMEDAISLADLAALTGRSLYTFARAFAATTGVTPHQFVLARRVERGRRLIERHGSMPLAEIAYACGFSSQPHFSIVFKRFVGVSPGRYRTLIQSG